jgi:hypothetical protein
MGPKKYPRYGIRKRKPSGYVWAEGYRGKVKVTGWWQVYWQRSPLSHPYVMSTHETFADACGRMAQIIHNNLYLRWR